MRRHGKEPESDLLIQLPDETHTFIDIESTDYAQPSGDNDSCPPPTSRHLLDFAGLCRVARLVAQLCQENQATQQADHENQEVSP